MGAALRGHRTRRGHGAPAPGGNRCGSQSERRLAIPTGVPHADLRTEMAALRHYQGQGSVNLLDDNGINALLLEKLVPGTPLHATGNDTSRTRLVAQVVQRLRPVPPQTHDFPDWMAYLEKTFRQGRKDLAEHAD